MSVKIPQTKHKVIDLITKRWSARAFSEELVDEDCVAAMLEAASWAPSAMNEQPWRYIVGIKQKHKGFQTLLSCLNKSNAVWAENASVLIFCYTKLTYTKSGKENVNAMHDAGMANQNLLLQAASMDIYSHVMEGFDKSKAMEIFNIPDDFNPVCMIALGYRGNPEELQEPYKSRETSPRERKDLSEFVTYLK